MSASRFNALSSALSRLIVAEIQRGDVEAARMLVKQLGALWAARLA